MRAITCKIFKTLYRIFLMPYIERDRYFKQLCENTKLEDYIN